jgi:hypothetical protein
MSNQIKPLTRIRNKEDICENCLYCVTGELKGNLDIRSRNILECRAEPPQNIFANDGVIIQPKMTIPGFWCRLFEK